MGPLVRRIVNQFIRRRVSFGFLALAAAAVIIKMYPMMTPSTTATATIKDESMNTSHEEVLQTNKTMQEQEAPIEMAQHEPYLNRWDRRFSSSSSGGYVFFKHIRKAGGTSIRQYIESVFKYHGLSRTATDREKMILLNQTQLITNDISYIEQEWDAMDWECPAMDQRWKQSLSIIVLRHPIERHLSEFFFSGAATRKGIKNVVGSKRLIQPRQLHLNNYTYMDILARFINEEVPFWMVNSKIHTKRRGIFGRFYQDNFQLRALAGCSSGVCLESKLEPEFRDMVMESNVLHPLNHSYHYNAMCTHFFPAENSNEPLVDKCSGPRRDDEQCSLGCDGPCFYPTIAMGALDQNDVARALEALKEFDAILPMETLKNDDQSAFINDLMGIPRDVKFSLNNVREKNRRVYKSSQREVTHFYRDLLTKLNLTSLLLRLEEENKLEIEFYNRAFGLRDQQMKVWRKETGWED